MSTSASSNLPRFDVSPNTGKPLNVHHRTETAIKRIHQDGAHSSHVVQLVGKKGHSVPPRVASMVKPALSVKRAALAYSPDQECDHSTCE